MKKTVTILCVMMFMVGLSAASAQLIKTQIILTVRNDLGNTVDGVSVKLFENEDDYKNEKNAVAEGVTDNKGVVKFKELKAIPYFILAKKGDLNNFGGGEETGTLESARINKVTVVIN